MAISRKETVASRRKDKLVFAKKLGEHLRKVRRGKGISQENLSMDAGYYRTYVGKIEQGSYSPSAHTIWKLAKSLGMTLEQFFDNFS